MVHIMDIMHIMDSILWKLMMETRIGMLMMKGSPERLPNRGHNVRFTLFSLHIWSVVKVKVMRNSVPSLDCALCTEGTTFNQYNWNCPLPQPLCPRLEPPQGLGGPRSSYVVAQGLVRNPPGPASRNSFLPARRLFTQGGSFAVLPDWSPSRG